MNGCIVRAMKNTRYGFGWSDPRGVFTSGKADFIPTHTRTIVDENKHRIIMYNYEVHHGNNKQERTTSGTNANA